MRSLALAVPRSEGERVRRELLRDRRLRGELRILEEPDRVLLPIWKPPTEPAPLGVLVEADFDEVPAAPARSYRDLLRLPAAEAALLPRAFDVVGDIVLIRLPRELETRAPEVGAALLAFVPRARLVGLDRGVHGPERRRTLERIAGTGPWATRHSENGLRIDVDLERAYFSPRLAREHARVAGAVRSGETVYDICCGVGPFSLLVARDGRARQILAVDVNPDAIELLRQNLKRLGLAARVQPIESSIEEFIPTAKPAERVIFNLPREGIKYAPRVGTVVEQRGALHYYELTERTAWERRPSELSSALGSSPGRFRLVERHVVHPYSPLEDLVAYTMARDEV